MNIYPGSERLSVQTDRAIILTHLPSMTANEQLFFPLYTPALNFHHCSVGD